MIACFLQNNRFKEAFELFRRMRVAKVELDGFVAASMLSACTATIVDMYCKCGCLEEAFQVFNGLPLKKGVSLWNCMIGGLAVHGKGEDAIGLFKEMEREMVAPDGITFVNLLTACAHSGLVEEGRY